MSEHTSAARRAFVLLCASVLVAGGCGADGGSAMRTTLAAATAGDAADTGLAAYQPRHGRARPLVAVVGENYYTEIVDYVVPYGIISASQAADVVALGTQPGPIRMFPAPVNVQPEMTTAGFDTAHPEGADYVIVPAVHRDEDPALLSWVKGQAAKGAVVVGVCDGVWVLAHAGLLNGRKATGHWYSVSDLRKQYPAADFVPNRRYVMDDAVVTTTGVSAVIPASLALVEAIAGSQRAAGVAAALGTSGNWSAAHPSERFRLDMKNRLTIARNALSFWNHEDLGLPIADGVDEIALALTANAYSATFKSTVYTVAPQKTAVRSKRGLVLLPDRSSAEAKGLRMLPPPNARAPVRSLDEALQGIEHDYGRDTASWVALQMEYPGY